MAGRDKKKSSSKKKTVQKPPKYVVAPASPAKTRSSDVHSSESSTVKGSAPKVATPTPPKPSASLEDLEKKFDSKIAKMETSFRSALSEASLSSSALRSRSGPTAQSLEPREQDATAPKERSRRDRDHPSPSRRVRSPSRHHHRRRHASSHRHGHHRSASRSSLSSRSSSSSSSSSSGSSRSSSSASDYSSERRRRSHRRRHSRRRTRSSHKKSKYDTSKYLREGKKLNTYERLVLANAKMALALYKKKRDIRGFLEHVILVAEMMAHCLQQRL